jgi:hypothetical protein
MVTVYCSLADVLKTNHDVFFDPNENNDLSAKNDLVLSQKTLYANDKHWLGKQHYAILQRTGPASIHG